MDQLTRELEKLTSSVIQHTVSRTGGGGEREAMMGFPFGQGMLA